LKQIPSCHLRRRSELEAEWMRLEAIGEAFTSQYASGLVLVRKKDGGMWECIDCRDINKDTTLDRYPITCIDNLIDIFVSTI